MDWYDLFESFMIVGSSMYTLSMGHFTLLEYHSVTLPEGYKKGKGPLHGGERHGGRGIKRFI